MKLSGAWAAAIPQRLAHETLVFSHCALDRLKVGKAYQSLIDWAQLSYFSRELRKLEQSEVHNYMVIKYTCDKCKGRGLAVAVAYYFVPC